MELLVQDTSLIAIADAIREKAETTGELAFPNGFVEAISALVGLPNSVTALAGGTYTPTSDLTNYADIQHGLSVVPNFVFICVDGTYNNEYNATIARLLFKSTPYTGQTGSVQAVWYHKDDGNYYSSVNGYSDRVLTSDTFRFFPYESVPIKGGVTYYWIAAYIDGIHLI